MKVRLAFGVLAILGLVAGACGPAAQPAATTAPTAAPATAAATAARTTAPTPAPPPLKVTVLVGTQVPVVALAPQTSIANVLGYWKEENLEVTVQTGVQGDAQVIQLLGTNQGTAGVVDATTLLNAREKGVPLKSVYIYVRTPFNSVYVLDSSPIKTIAELKGKVLGTYNTVGGALYAATHILKGAGLELGKDVQFVNIGFNAATVQALKDGKADAYVVTEPDVLEQLGGVKFRRIEDNASKDHFGFVWAFPEQFIKEQPNAVVGIMRGVAKATLFATTNPTAAVQAHWKAFPASKAQGVDDATALKQGVAGVQGRFAKYRLGGPTEKWGTIPNEAARWQVMVDVSLLGGAITQKPNIAAVHTTEFIDRINQFDSAKIVDQAKNYKP